jgi:hypothetical protein
MANRRTNRTEGVYLKVSPEVKADIRRKIKLGFNLSEEVEMWYRRKYMIKQEIEEQIFLHKQKLSEYETALDKIETEEAEEKRLTLDANTLYILKDTCAKFKAKDQFVVFQERTKSSYNEKDFKLLKKKYL